MADKTTTEPKKKRHLFEDISLVQVVATALAAVTSMLLASYIGIAGSVIGVAVASVVSTTAASLYKHFLRESAEKIKEIPAVGKTHHLLEHAGTRIGIGDGEDADSKSGGMAAEPEDADQIEHERTRAEESGASQDDGDGTIPLDELAVASNVVTIPMEEIEEANEPENEEIGSEAGIHEMDGNAQPDHGEEATGSDEEGTIEQIERSKRRMRVGLIIVCVVSALVAVALSAIVIYVTSGGEGIGTKPQTIFVHTQSEDAAKDGDDADGSGGSASSGSSSSSAGSSSASSSDSQDSSSQGSSASSASEDASSSDATQGSHSGDDGGDGSSDASSSDGASEGGE